MSPVSEPVANDAIVAKGFLSRIASLRVDGHDRYPRTAKSVRRDLLSGECSDNAGLGRRIEDRVDDR
jgi:hypothetical protein